MADDVLELPQRGRDRLVAHLLGDGDAVALDLAVGVIRTEADEGAALPSYQDELDLAGGVVAADLDRIFCGQPARRAAVIDWRRRRPCDADRFELGDMLVARDGIAAGPAGDDGLLDRKRQRH